MIAPCYVDETTLHGKKPIPEKQGVKGGDQEGGLNLLVARVNRGGRLWCAGLKSVVKTAVIVGLHVEVAVHAVADFQLRPAKLILNITGSGPNNG